MASTHAWDNLTHDMREEMHDLTHFATVDAAHQSRVALWATFVALPVLWGLDMMTNAVTDSTTWEGSISTWADNFLPGNAADAVMWVGAITLLLGLLVAAVPQFGADVLGIWFVLLAVNLFSVDQMAYLALGMLALAVCCFCMARMMRGDHRREA
ncbi:MULTISPECIES: hypothetical protein [unclassified Nocardioides]|uniref:hypothetical protein n=1 Tax=unclassified Nocardioides TaxID=2615069 RepID=UPI001154CE51|nr:MULTISPECIES: hypothetical protein [unclassified Nocardioides]TQK71694.1 hypothetical protein FBY23_3492 [Nocardioides sp. SLBN-35]WGY04129.1 hypothetical protein QI633_10255 [Nocardioides sp. QY071]